MKGAHQPNDVPSTSGVWKWFLCILWESFSLIWSCPKNLICFDFLGDFWSPQKFYGAIFQRLWIRHCDWSGQKFEDAEYLRCFFLWRLIFRGTLSYGVNQLLNQKIDINKKRKNTGSRRKGCLVGKLSNSKKQTHQWSWSLEAFLQISDTMLWSKTSDGLWKSFWSFI